jgi:hypothetical protein
MAITIAATHTAERRLDPAAGGSIPIWVGGAESSCQGSSSLRLVSEDGPRGPLRRPDADGLESLSARNDPAASEVQRLATGADAGSVVGGAGGSVERFVVAGESSVSAGGDVPLRSSW